MITLREYQTEAVEKIRGAYRSGNRRVLLVSPTGSGKTVIFCYVASGAAAKGNSILILAHRDVICEQISAELGKHELEHGLIMAGHSMRPGLPVQVGMMGTVARRLDKFKPSMVIIDEAHRACGNTYKRILSAFPEARSLLVTATPQRTDGKPMGDVADIIVEGPKVRWLMENGHLSKYRLFCPPPLVNLSEISSTGGDYNQGELQKAMDLPEITGDALDHYKRIAFGKLFVTFTTGTKHSEDIAQKFTEGGVPTRNIDGTMRKDHIKSVLRALENREILGVTSCNLISEGFDLPAIEVAILLRPTMSLIVYLQQVGRALRRSPGKEYAIILDHVGNSVRFLPDGTPVRKHGLPDEDRQWSLDAVERKKKENLEADIAVKRCDDCLAMYAGHLRRCPYCAHENPVRSTEMEQAEGELHDVTSDSALYERLRNMRYDEFMDSVKTPEEIKAFRAIKGHNPIWSLRTAMSKFGVTDVEAARMLGYKPGIVYMARKASRGKMATG